LRAQRCRVHRIPPRVRDDRDTPLKWGRTGGVVKLICPTAKEKYFCKWGWTAKSSGRALICPSGNQLAYPDYAVTVYCDAFSK
jgi:hypothetical protein